MEIKNKHAKRVFFVAFSHNRRNQMTQQQYVINRKLNMLELGEKLGNISEACRQLNITRQHFYDIKGALENEGLEGLLEKARNKPRFGNRVSSEIEKEILDYSLLYPTHGQVRTSVK